MSITCSQRIELESWLELTLVLVVLERRNYLLSSHVLASTISVCRSLIRKNPGTARMVIDRANNTARLTPLKMEPITRITRVQHKVAALWMSLWMFAKFSQYADVLTPEVSSLNNYYFKNFHSKVYLKIYSTGLLWHIAGYQSRLLIWSINWSVILLKSSLFVPLFSSWPVKKYIRIKYMTGVYSRFWMIANYPDEF